MENPPEPDKPEDTEPAIEPTPSRELDRRPDQEPPAREDNVFAGSLEKIINREEEQPSPELRDKTEREMDKKHEAKESTDAQSNPPASSKTGTRADEPDPNPPRPIGQILEERMQKTSVSSKRQTDDPQASSGGGVTYRQAIAIGFKLALVLFVVILLIRLVG